LSIAPNLAMQDESSESQPVDQVEVTKVTGTVQKVDPDKRTMTIKLDNGKKKTLKVDKSVRDLEQFKPGDRVQESYTEEIIAMAERSDEGTAKLAKYGAVDVEPEGDKPALVKVDTSEITGKIVSIDPKKRRLKFEAPDGKARTLKLSHKIKDLDRFRPGETINMAITDQLVVEIVE
jgi:Cu/Ag efflux protein CusF